MTETALLPAHTADEGHELTPEAINRVNETLGFGVDHTKGPSIVRQAAQGAPIHVKFEKAPEQTQVTPEQ